jgi:hypothetical protein
MTLFGVYAVKCAAKRRVLRKLPGAVAVVHGLRSGSVPVACAGPAAPAQLQPFGGRQAMASPLPGDAPVVDPNSEATITHTAGASVCLE